MNFSKWVKAFLLLLTAALVLVGAVTAVIDPFFHYHAPLRSLQYELYYQRYQNDGIVKHFDYDAILTGNSLSENFLASQLDALFGVRSVKVPFSGASPKELDENNSAAIKANPNIKMLVMNLDYGSFIKDKDSMSYDADDYPVFLYNANPFDDVKYLFNKDILASSLKVLRYTAAGNRTTSFDAYSFWGNDPETAYGEAAIKASFDPGYGSGEIYSLDAERRELLRGNIEQNVVRLVEENPQIDFYFFYPPYSMYFWAKMYNIGELSLQLEAERAVTELLIDYENVHLFSFLDAFELVSDYNRYKDYIHYDADVNAWMLECMAKDEHRLTRENLDSYTEKTRKYYSEYDYDAFFAG